MKQFTHIYQDLKTLQNFYTQHVSTAETVIIQVHTQDKNLSGKIVRLFEKQRENLKVISVLQNNVPSTLHFSVYPDNALLQNHSFFEQDLYKAIIESTKEGFWMLDEELNIISVNHSFAEMLGYKESEILGKKPFELLSLIGEQQSFCQEQSKEVNRSVQRTYELTFVTKNKHELHTIVNATTIDLPESCVRTFAFITDISEQKKLEQRLLEHKQNIDLLNNDLTERVNVEVQANRDKDHIMYQQARLASMGEMIANIAHQWRQPLNIIALIIQEFYILSELGTLDREKVEKEYTRANDVLQYMSNTIDDFRTFFQHNGKSEQFNVQSAVDSVMSLVSKSMENNNIEVELVFEDEGLVFGHKNEFVQTLINLLNNAREAIVTYREEGGHISVHSYLQDNAVHVLVNDNGGGITEEALAQVFEPYFTTKHQTQGTGLGLYMSYQIIVNNMAGSMIVESKNGESCFHITLPNSKMQLAQEG